MLREISFVIFSSCVGPFFLKKKRDFIYFLERGRERQTEEETHQRVVSSRTPPIGNLTRNPGMCPDQELNW